MNNYSILSVFRYWNWSCFHKFKEQNQMLDFKPDIMSKVIWWKCFISFIFYITCNNTRRSWTSHKKQLVAQFTRHLTVRQQQRFHSIARHTLQLSETSHLLSDEKSVSNLWQCSTSLFSLTCFYELSYQAFLTTSALLHTHASDSINTTHDQNSKQ